MDGEDGAVEVHDRVIDDHCLAAFSNPLGGAVARDDAVLDDEWAATIDRLGTATKTAAYNITWAWTNTNTTLTITIGTRTSGSQDAAITGALTFNPTTAVTNTLSATGAYHNCDSNSGGGNCLPTITGSF
jgi:hypothetical protein